MREKDGASVPNWHRALLLLIPLAALLVAMPLQNHGVSCGDDFPFHVQSWVDAATQFRHGTLYPQWAYSAAYNAGEPRFAFYPPISWLIGAAIELVFPRSHAGVLFIGIALLLAGLAMYKLAREFTSIPGAVVCGALYSINPYMLLNAVERSAFGELLCAAWIPLLFWGVLKPRLTPLAIAIPLCLLWLTNVPTAVGTMYTVVLLLACRMWSAARSHDGGGAPRRVALNGLVGLVLGAMLAAFFILPAALERPYIQVGRVFTAKGYRIKDGYLFHYMGQANHDQTLKQVSQMAIAYLLLTLLALAVAHWRSRKEPNTPVVRTAITAMLCCSLVLFFALTPQSGPFWHMPELQYLQFPWRLLSILAVVAAVSLALALGARPKVIPYAVLLTPFLMAFMVHDELHSFRRYCLVPNFDQFIAGELRGGHGMRQTPEYTPAGASDLGLHTNNPPFWLTTSVNAYAPNTIASPDPNMDQSYAPGAVPDATLSQHAPNRIEVQATAPEILVLNLRDYPTWQVTDNGQALPHLKRTDGLIAVPVPAGGSDIEVRWVQPTAVRSGALLSGLAVIFLIGTEWKSRLARRTPEQRDATAA